MRIYKNVELDKATADKFGKFLKANNIYYEASGVGMMTHFEVLVDESETELCNNFLESEEN